MSKQAFGKLLIIVVLLLLLGAQVSSANDILRKIDTKNYPAVKLILSSSVFNGLEENNRLVQVKENGRQVKDVRVGQLKEKPEPISVTLLIDSSGSMKGKPIEDAKTAANHFIGLLGEEDQVSIISFNSTANLIADYTADKQSLTGAINDIQASGETALYDALALATDQVSKSGQRQKYIVLLSDGGDTVSKSDPSSYMDNLRTLKVPVYIIALKSPEFDVGVLESIIKQSSGKLVQAIDSSELKPFYSRLATQIKNEVEVEYKSPGFNTKDIDLDIAIGQGNNAVLVSTAYQNPALLGSYKGNGDGYVKPIVDYWFVRLIIALIVFSATSLFAYGFFATVTRKKSTLSKQLSMYEEIWNKEQETGQTPPAESNPYVSKALDLVGHFADKRGFTDLVRQKLEQAGLPLRPVEYIFFHALIVIVPSVVLQLIYGKVLMSILYILVSTVLPILFVQATIDRRQRRFNDMLPDTISMIAGSLRAGYSLLQAISLVSEESRPPISTEFKRALTEARLGLPIEQALEKAARRVGSEDFYWTVLAINIQREVGGNLAEVLDIVAKTIREREALKRQIKSLTAEGRLSAYILIALPFFMTIVLFLMNPGYIMLLFSHLMGWIMVGVATVLMIIGIFWMRKIISIEV